MIEKRKECDLLLGEGIMGKYSNIKWENLAVDSSNADKIQPVPKEIFEYYIARGYNLRGIPLNADTCKEIAELL